MKRPLQAILFDLGETLLNFGPVDVPALFNEGARLAYDYLRKQGTPLPPIGWYMFRHQLSIRAHVVWSRLTNREFNSLDLLGHLSRQMGLSLSRKQLLELCGLWYAPLRRQCAAETGAAELLTDLARRGLRVALVSNTFIPGEVLDEHLRDEGMLAGLPVRVYSCDVGWRKPHRRIFDSALRKIGSPDPREAMYVGDKLRADVLGAGRLGMRTVLKAPEPRWSWPWPKPDHVVRRLADLRKVLDGYRIG